MIAGHFGLAAAVKAREPATPLWALMLASQWMDVVFVPLFVAKVETLEPIAGAATNGGQPGYGQAIIHADYTHSLVGALVLALVFALPAAWRWGRRSGVVLGAVVMSHFVLDLLMHHHDMPILPGDRGMTLGFGLWRWPALSIALELALVLGGSFAYARAALATTRAADPARLGRARLASGIVLASGLVTLALNALGM